MGIWRLLKVDSGAVVDKRLWEVPMGALHRDGAQLRLNPLDRMIQILCEYKWISYLVINFYFFLGFTTYFISEHFEVDLFAILSSVDIEHVVLFFMSKRVFAFLLVFHGIMRNALVEIC